MIKHLLILAAGICLAACTQNSESASVVSESEPASAEQQKGTYENISADQAKQMIDNEEVIILDVRTPEEYESGHIPNARLMNFNSGDFEQQLQELPKGEAILVYCHSGNRSSRAMQQMEESGFTAVYNLEGGISGWKRANHQVEE